MEREGPKGYIRERGGKLEAVLTVGGRATGRPAGGSATGPPSSLLRGGTGTRPRSRSSFLGQPGASRSHAACGPSHSRPRVRPAPR